MSFQFVESGKIDSATRRKIRSHVMKGKNAGRVRVRPNRPVDSDAQVLLSARTNLYDFDSSRRSSDSDDTTAWITRPVGDLFSYFRFPVKMQPYMKDLIYPFMVSQLEAIYPLQFCMPTPFMKSVWFQYLLSSEACELPYSDISLSLMKAVFYCALALSEQAAAVDDSKGEVSPQRLHHLASTYRLINRDLERNRVPSDATIAVTVSLTVHEDLRYQFGTTKVHLDAVERMVELRGGLDCFSKNWILLQKLCRADINFAIHQGWQSRFYRDEFPHAAIESIMSRLAFDHSFQSAQSRDEVRDLQLQSILADLTKFCNLLNRDLESFRLESAAFQECLISICYRLLRLYPFHCKQPGNRDDRTMQLGLLAFMTTLLFKTGRIQDLHYDLLADVFRDGVCDYFTDEMMLHTNHLWLLFVGGISVFGPDDHMWLLPQLKSCLCHLKIDDWNNARETIKRLPWIDMAHDKAGHELWQSVVWQ